MPYSNQSGPVRTRKMTEREKQAFYQGKRVRNSERSNKGARACAPAPSPSGEITVVDGIEAHIVRKRVKNVNLRIARDGSHVDVSAPSWVSDSEVEAFIRSKSAWIASHMAQAAQTPMACAARATPEEVAAWRETVSACAPALVAAWEPIMGVKAGKLAYRNMTSRWGSCQPATGRICINVRLALYPPECLEYVVVHELCHLLERGHGPRFHQLMDAFMPDWKQRRAKLR
ncbi:M48 family metallopeptidase [Ellagibacter isourolithinifaciens]|uniref:M48 family metallopeptidase n=1 Tax=Ellagibacter isourolithinifaciens TaxID=2137581 RepID=UPI003AAE37F7